MTKQQTAANTASADTSMYLETMRQAKPLFWENPATECAARAIADSGFTEADARDAEARLARFAPYLAEVFPETRAAGGIIESELRPVPAMYNALVKEWGLPKKGQLLLKLDSHLPVSGSIKARGGIYEVLCRAESLALDAGILKQGDSYVKLAAPEAKEFFGGYSLAVGSTGNLGLAVGLMGAMLGFKTSVHMSSDARQWKKDLLRSRGVNVVEYESDYSAAVAAGRAEAAKDPKCWFVDDENSRNLFLGYSVAGLRFGKQLEALGITVSVEQPLVVYIPCGVGGGPGGVAFGLKLAFGDNVACYFAEPVQAPAVSLGLISGLNDKISATEDLGLSGKTAADGLAVSRPSALVCKAMRHMLDGALTVEDATLFDLLRLLYKSEGIKLEPSALAGFPGVRHALAGEFTGKAHADNAVHVVWATGGSLVPEGEWEKYALCTIR